MRRHGQVVAEPAARRARDLCDAFVEPGVSWNGVRKSGKSPTEGMRQRIRLARWRGRAHSRRLAALHQPSNTSRP
ncbi:hypothetical protein [Streptomyces odontomachi]|uniref:hypothetical protein n=1 Tax=Streptomyces odontomachi TaxID=2944940 RepID=UPI00210AE183|nr:hypothetical protein [Streptomyces sp. ODS25]